MVLLLFLNFVLPQKKTNYLIINKIVFLPLKNNKLKNTLYGN
jgi:hypothetical protein